MSLTSITTTSSPPIYEWNSSCRGFSYDNILREKGGTNKTWIVYIVTIYNFELFGQFGQHRYCIYSHKQDFKTAKFYKDPSSQ